MELYKKYRPKKFKDVIGNTPVINSLHSIVRREEPPHAYLFTGPSGVGKTTLARIVANKLGCSRSGISELNTANYRGIDHVRELIQQTALMPLKGKRRAWILDESHQISRDGQEALLKILEDTPPHVYFLLATTNPEKLKSTIRNRCSCFDLQSIPEEIIGRLIRKVAAQEEKEMPKSVRLQIQRDCLGSARAALVMLDQILDLPKSKMSLAARRAGEQEQEAISLCRALVKKSQWKEVATILKGLTNQDPERLRLAVLGYCKSILLNGKHDHAFFIMESFKDPFYNTGHAGLVKSCYEIINGG